MWEPSQVGTWLGFHLDFSLNIISVPVSKITKLQESISRVRGLPLTNAKDLAGIASQLNSMFLAIGNIVHLMTRSMYAQISAQRSWLSTFSRESSVVEELVFWQSKLGRLIGRRIWFKSSAVRVAYSDASDSGCGGYIVELGPQVAAQGVWSADSAMGSSTMREILAVRKVLQSFAPKLAGLCVSGTRTTRMLPILLTLVIGSLVCKKRLSLFLRFAFFMVSLSSRNGCPDQVTRRRII